MIYLPDTNVFSRFLRGGEANEGLRDRLLAQLPFCRLSAIVLSELEYGAAKSGNPAHRERVARLRSILPDVVPFDAESATCAGQIRAHLATLKPNAQPIGSYDVLLAGQALALGACVVTGNSGEFHRVPGLPVEDWK
ncbi:type II toxin-antitoxin system VapC family toxin [Oleiharenicola lentus]|uniref:Ribonuclease VapC n=1 Tax=Oleiharenicola lentus TaxID=2508720 RepID=A0A4V1M636_9BACT|nr:type II toxin-antitoxin system VapC family toxin [Oleiharenicola lentus]RXK53646.1 type II toxin-antitoxin system VapC family toxin [Oleiharenicola lentus]